MVAEAGGLLGVKWGQLRWPHIALGLAAVAAISAATVGGLTPWSARLAAHATAGNPATARAVAGTASADASAAAATTGAPGAAAANAATSASATPGADGPALATTTPGEQPTTFAVIGDFGVAGSDESHTADLVKSWNPAYIITTGDNYYDAAKGSGVERYDNSITDFYARWVKDELTTHQWAIGEEPPINEFFPVLGNHDYSSAKPGPSAYLAYFNLPGTGFQSSTTSERYYDFVEGPIHWFMLNSNPEEPDGISADSAQARWLKDQLKRSTSRWNIVVDHHPPYSSDLNHGSDAALRWPYRDWGADIMFSGHAHVYERIMRDHMIYVVDGIGGAHRYPWGNVVSGSVVRYNDTWGAVKGIVTSDTLTFEFRAADSHKLIDRFVVPPVR